MIALTVNGIYYQLFESKNAVLYTYGLQERR